MLDRPMLKPSFEPALLARPYPQVIKYMGSKAGIIDFVVEGINAVHSGGRVCDLFAGACSLSGALAGQVPMLSNDIQTYSSIIAQTYLHRLSERAQALGVQSIVDSAEALVARALAQAPTGLSYPQACSLSEFNHIEELNRQLIDCHFDGPYHLYLRNYSGTWWSAEQCAWIDALRQVADNLLKTGEINAGDHAVLLTCVMHAMAYAGQGTGHYAQYRDAKTTSSMADINIYRQKSVAAYFARKFEAVAKWNAANVSETLAHQTTTLDFTECLGLLDGDTVYADPPYAFVHYSRFYHAIETFVLYDHPTLQEKGGMLVKGRYREERHQSPFSIRSQVPGAFEALFRGIEKTGSNLVLSYSNTALFNLPELVAMAKANFSSSYNVTVLTKDHQHMTMGRKNDRNREVEEALILVSR
jgi:adenine-specific DNA-methyltransferase